MKIGRGLRKVYKEKRNKGPNMGVAFNSLGNTHIYNGQPTFSIEGPQLSIFLGFLDYWDMVVWCSHFLSFYASFFFFSFSNFGDTVAICFVISSNTSKPYIFSRCTSTRLDKVAPSISQKRNETATILIFFSFFEM